MGHNQDSCHILNPDLKLGKREVQAVDKAKRKLHLQFRPKANKGEGPCSSAEEVRAELLGPSSNGVTCSMAGQ